MKNQINLPQLIGSVGDREGTRTITSIVALLIVLGIALVMLAVWLRRATRPDHELLAPLEVMGERRWRRSEPVSQRRRLDELRPGDASPLQPSIAPPEIDEAFDRGPTAFGFDDLHDGPGANGMTNTGEHPIVGPSSSANGDQPDDNSQDDDSPADDSRVDRRPRKPVIRKKSDRPVHTGSEPTPSSLDRPMVDELPEGDMDPELVEAAMAELDAELATEPSDGQQSLDLAPPD
jgi:hypothetical protein